MSENTKAIMDAIASVDTAIVQTQLTKVGTANTFVIYDADETVEKLEKAKAILVSIDEDFFQGFEPQEPTTAEVLDDALEAHGLTSKEIVEGIDENMQGQRHVARSIPQSYGLLRRIESGAISDLEACLRGV